MPVQGDERLLIGGALTAAADGATYPVVNPATEEVIGVAADAGPADLEAAVSAARRAFDDTNWSTDVAFRVRCLRQLHEALTAHADELRGVIVAEVGCPVMLTHSAQLDIPVSGVGWVADLLEGYGFETDLGVLDLFGIPSRRTLRREAAGVVGAITPWNFPMQINLAKVAPALAAGCTVVLKAAPDTPWTASLLGRIAATETDLPPGVLNVLTSSRNEIGAGLAAHRDVDLVSFTGSTATGRAVMTAAAGNLTRVFLELGGKSAAVVLDDADLDTALANTAFQITTNAGQGCAITSRLLLPRSRYDEALESLVALLASFPYGDPTDPGNLMGPLISERQRQRVLGYIDTGVREGARVALGGTVPEHLPTGFYVEPTVLADVAPDATVAQEEIFGPVLAVIPYEGGDDEAVAIANDSAYGLSGAVFSASADRARAVANRIRTGTLAVNGATYYGPDAPFGGYKHSGIGREMGVLGFEEYLEAKTIAEPA